VRESIIGFGGTKRGVGNLVSVSGRPPDTSQQDGPSSTPALGPFLLGNRVG
jgi:hypothetical protein